MAKSKQWTVLEDRNLSQELTSDLSYAIHHSFGRGKFRSVAEGMIVPKIVLDQIVGTQCWTDQPRVSVPTQQRKQQSRPWASLVGGAAPAAAKVGVARGEVRPRSSGRARALHLRVQKASVVQQRRPGHQVTIVCISALCCLSDCCLSDCCLYVCLTVICMSVCLYLSDCCIYVSLYICVSCLCCLSVCMLLYYF